MKSLKVIAKNAWLHREKDSRQVREASLRGKDAQPTQAKTFNIKDVVCTYNSKYYISLILYCICF